MRYQSNINLKDYYSNTTAFKKSLPLWLPLMIIFFSGCAQNETLKSQESKTTSINSRLSNPKVSHDKKQKGIHVFGRLDSGNIKPLQDNHFEWITLVPFGDQKEHDSPFMKSHWGDSIEISERNNRWIDQITLAKESGFKVFVKPHIWLHTPSSGKWRSDVYPTTDDNWELWKESYRNFIFRWAHIAELADAEMFCVGTELTRLTIEKPEFWKALIAEIKTIYSGKITYAANWYEEYEKITFWEDLDFIGIQAYFPLAKDKAPTVEQISKGWEKHLSQIEAVYKKHNRPILFTELGYKSTTDSALRPWEWIDYSLEKDISPSPETQVNCYHGFFNAVWDKEWFAGVHIWQWNTRVEKGRGLAHLDFTPQYKPAEQVIAEWFLKK